MRRMLDWALGEVPRDLITPRYEADAEWVFTSEEHLRHVVRGLRQENLNLKTQLELEKNRATVRIHKVGE